MVGTTYKDREAQWFTCCLRHRKCIGTTYHPIPLLGGKRLLWQWSYVSAEDILVRIENIPNASQTKTFKIYTLFWLQKHTIWRRTYPYTVSYIWESTWRAVCQFISCIVQCCALAKMLARRHFIWSQREGKGRGAFGKLSEHLPPDSAKYDASRITRLPFH